MSIETLPEPDEKFAIAISNSGILHLPAIILSL